MVLRDYEPLFTSSFGAVLAVLLGLLWGSFANVCIYRWPPTDEHPHGRSVIKPGSHCSACKAPIAWYDNVPILSYLWLRGHCRNCKVSFSPRYLLVEALTGVLFGVAWWFTLGTGGMYTTFEHGLLKFVIDATFIFAMVVITFIDIDTMLILDKITYPSVVIGYVASLLDHRWWEGLVGAAIGFALPWGIAKLYKMIRGVDGLGGGDLKFLAVAGAVFGWQGVIASLFGGSVLGSIIGTYALLRSKRKQGPEEKTDIMKVELPFGPFLAAAAVFYLFAEPWIAVHSRLL